MMVLPRASDELDRRDQAALEVVDDVRKLQRHIGLHQNVNAERWRACIGGKLRLSKTSRAKSRRLRSWTTSNPAASSA